MRPLLLCSCLGLLTGGCGSGDDDEAASVAFTPAQRLLADQIVSVFENDTPVIDYGYAENLDDGRGITAGRAGFTTATGDLLEVVERYTQIVPGTALAAYLPRLRELAAQESDAVDGLEGLEEAWAAAAADPRFCEVQDEVVDDEDY